MSEDDGYLSFERSKMALKETSEISKKVNLLKMEIQSVPADGHCLFHAISHQLKVRHEMNIEMKELRRIAGEELLKNKILFSFHVILDRNETYEQYCRKIKDGDRWGGQVEVVALSQNLKLKVFVHQTTLTTHGGPLEIVGDNNGKIIHISFHKYFACGEHYNSIVDASKTEK